MVVLDSAAFALRHYKAVFNKAAGGKIKLPYYYHVGAAVGQAKDHAVTGPRNYTGTIKHLVLALGLSKGVKV